MILYCFLEVIQGEEGQANAIKPVFTDATKQMLVWQPPSVLTLHLKRFEQVGRGLRKVNKHIEFPLQLDLSSFCHVNKSVCAAFRYPVITKIDVYRIYV